MDSQRGFVSATECGVKDGDEKGHFVVAGIGPKGGNRRYLWLSTEETQNLMVRLGKALAADAANRGDKPAAMDALAAVNVARDEIDATLVDLS